MNRLSVGCVAKWVLFAGMATLALTLLGACTGAVGTLVKARPANLFDSALNAAIFTKCKAASIGAIDRRYMQTHEGWELWYRECRGAGDLRLPMPALADPRVNPDG